MRTIKEMVINNQKVNFQFYRDNKLWYSTECGFEFPVPIEDVGNATFLRQDRAILFIRYIRKHREWIIKSKTEQENLTPK